MAERFTVAEIEVWIEATLQVPTASDALTFVGPLAAQTIRFLRLDAAPLMTRRWVLR